MCVTHATSLICMQPRSLWDIGLNSFPHIIASLQEAIINTFILENLRLPDGSDRASPRAMEPRSRARARWSGALRLPGMTNAERARWARLSCTDIYAPRGYSARVEYPELRLSWAHGWTPESGRWRQARRPLAPHHTSSGPPQAPPPAPSRATHDAARWRCSVGR